MFVMFDVVEGKVKNIMFCDGERPEKIYTDDVDHYGDRRDRWMTICELEEALSSKHIEITMKEEKND